MAQYKVLQDIEAEDKLLGPLTLRQFIYAIIVIVLGFVAFRLAVVGWYLAVPFLPPLVFFAMLAAPFGHDQSSEVWMLAKIKYFIFPRKRIWSQDGIEEMVKVTAPKIDKKQLTKDFNKEEARSRLKALANTMDTRGWAIKNVSTNVYASPLSSGTSDRLLDIQTIPQADITAVKTNEDLLDADTTPLAQTINSMVAENQQAHRTTILQEMHEIAESQKVQNPQQYTAPAEPIVYTATPSMEPLQDVQVPAAPMLAQAQVVDQPDYSPPAQAPVSATQPLAKPLNQPMTQTQAPDIINPVKQDNKTELNVRSSSDNVDEHDGEVTISLH